MTHDATMLGRLLGSEIDGPSTVRDFCLLWLDIAEDLYDECRDGVVYFVKGARSVKIGRAKNVRQRFKALQCASPIPLSLLATMPGDSRLETQLHQSFGDYRRHGEWFRSDAPGLMDLIDTARKCYGEPRL